MDDGLNQRFQQLMLRFHQLGGELPPLERYEITPAQVVYLDFLANHPDSRLSDLAEALQFKPASVSSMISTLEARGLISKQPESEDARALSLALTERGSAVIEEIVAFRSMRVQNLLAALSQAEKLTLIAILEKALLKEEER